MEVRRMKCSNRKSRHEERWWGIMRAPGNNIVSNPEAHWVVTCKDKSCRSLFMSILSFNKHFITSQVSKKLHVVCHKAKTCVSLVVCCWRLLAAVKWNWLQRGFCKKTLLVTVLVNYQSNRLPWLPVVCVKDTKRSKENVTHFLTHFTNTLWRWVFSVSSLCCTCHSFTAAWWVLGVCG